MLLPQTASGQKNFKGYPGGFGVLHDTTLCIGCRSCEEACNKVNKLPEPARSFDDTSVFDEKRRTDAESFTVVNKYKIGKKGKKPVYRKIQCNHCLEPACASACFVRAFNKSPEGAVIYNEDICVGCRYCMIACPFNIPAYEHHEPLSPRVMKCTLCYPRISKGKLPGCVESCPKEALSFSKRSDLIKIARERIRKYPSRYIDHIYGEHEAGGTSWLYLAGVSFEKLGLNTNLGNTPAPELTKGFLSAVPIVLTLWPGLLLGIYAMTKRKESLAKQERNSAVSEAVAKTKAEADKKADEVAQKLQFDKEKAVEKAVKKALEEAKKEEKTE
jgi:Fe-S-cluster-containing dehydrogenase component